MSITKSQVRSRIRTRLRNSSTTFHDNTYVDEMVLSVLRDQIANDLARANPDWYSDTRIYTAITDALDGTGYEMYPIPEDCGELRLIYRDDLSHKPMLWKPRREEQDRYRFNGVNRGTLSLGDSTYAIPRLYSGQSATPIGNRFRVLPKPTSTNEKFGVAYIRSPKLPVGDEQDVDVAPEFEEVLPFLTAHRMLMLDGDPHAENLERLLFGRPGTDDTGMYGRAKAKFAAKFTANMTLGQMRAGGS